MTHEQETFAELQRAGVKISKRDAALLRAISGKSTFAEWVEAGARGSHRITDERLLRACAVRAEGGRLARYLALTAPSTLIAEVPAEPRFTGSDVIGHTEVAENRDRPTSDLTAFVDDAELS